MFQEVFFLVYFFSVFFTITLTSSLFIDLRLPVLAEKNYFLFFFWVQALLLLFIYLFALPAISFLRELSVLMAFSRALMNEKMEYHRQAAILPAPDILNQSLVIFSACNNLSEIIECNVTLCCSQFILHTYLYIIIFECIWQALCNNALTYVICIWIGV